MGSEHIKYISLFLIILFTFGCTSKLDKQVLELVEGKNLWQEKLQGHNYSYDQVHRCFCSDNGKKIRVISNQTEVISAIYVDGSYPKSIKHLNNMKQHYEQILESLEEQESTKSVSVDIKYDKDLGYPTDIKYDGIGMDSGYTLEISNVKVIQ